MVCPKKQDFWLVRQKVGIILESKMFKIEVININRFNKKCALQPLYLIEKKNHEYLDDY